MNTPAILSGCPCSFLPGINSRPAILAIIRNTVAPSIALSMIAKV
jgi:hypothetical protein